MKKFKPISLFILLAVQLHLMGQTPFFKEKNDTMYFVVHYANWVSYHEAFADYYYHSYDATRFFSSAVYVNVAKQEDTSYREVLKSEAPFGIIVYYNGSELFRQDTGMVGNIYLAETVGTKYTKLVLPTWLEGEWEGEVYSRDHTNQLMAAFSFNKEDETFHVNYNNNERPVQLIVDSISENYVRCTELYFMDDMVRRFGSWKVEFQLLDETNKLYVKYPTRSKSGKFGIGFLDHVSSPKNNN